MMTTPTRLAPCAGTADRALIGLEAVARQFLERERPGRAAQVLADVDDGAATLRFFLALRGLEWHLSCTVERHGNGRPEPVALPDRDQWVPALLPVLVPLVTLVKMANSASTTAPRLLHDVAKGCAWLGFDVEMRGCMALLSAHVRPVRDLRQRVPLMDAGCMRLRDERPHLPVSPGMRATP
jgi:hypothetical protein